MLLCIMLETRWNSSPSVEEQLDMKRLKILKVSLALNLIYYTYNIKQVSSSIIHWITLWINITDDCIEMFELKMVPLCHGVSLGNIFLPTPNCRPWLPPWEGEPSLVPASNPYFVHIVMTWGLCSKLSMNSYICEIRRL